MARKKPEMEWRWSQNWQYALNHGCDGCGNPIDRNERVLAVTTPSERLYGEDKIECFCEDCGFQKKSVEFTDRKKESA